VLRLVADRVDLKDAWRGARRAIPLETAIAAARRRETSATLRPAFLENALLERTNARGGRCGLVILDAIRPSSDAALATLPRLSPRRSLLSCCSILPCEVFCINHVRKLHVSRSRP